MKKFYLTLALAATGIATTFAQLGFNKDLELDTDLLPSAIIMPASPLTMDPIFIGGVDIVQTTETYGNAAGETPAKQWHDFLGITPIWNNGVYEGDFWVTVNHERIQSDDMIGDGGGMTVFKCHEDENGKVTVYDDVTLEDGRNGKFFNVDFVNTVGETGMNCGGIQAPNGRIWTAEEWFRTSNSSIYADGAGVRDTMDVVVSSDVAGDFDGQTIRKYENFNYMVEIDPAQGKAIRKQYNWGRQGFEGGSITKDLTTVYFGVDANPTFFIKFVADVANDFTSGDLFVYKEDAAPGQRWIQIPNATFEDAFSVQDTAIAAGATMYNRLEWTAMDTTSGILYVTETGRDDIGARWADEAAEGATYAQHHIDRNAAMGTTINDDYSDLYGRVLMFDPATDEMHVLIEGGSSNPNLNNRASVGASNYPSVHLSNPDGLTMMYTNNGPFLLIQEDLNGSSHNRVPYGVSNRLCEMFALDLSIVDPTVDNLERITAVPHGAEITGARVTPSGKTILVNSQHPVGDELVNTYPFNNSLTVAITGFEGVLTSLKDKQDNKGASFTMHPNPVTRDFELNKVTDVAIYDMNGKLVKVAREVKEVNVSDLKPGTYVIKNKEEEALKFIIQ